MEHRERIFIGAAWPYSNGSLHLGHVAGCLLPADIFARYCRLKGYETLFVSGSDMHGTPITVTAEREGTTPEVVAERNHLSILETIGSLSVSYDLYTKTHTDHHFSVVQDIFLKLMAKGFIEKRSEEAQFCPSCSRFLPDRYVEGTCPHCGFEEARGDQCDRCGKVLDPKELKHPRCKLCSGLPELRETEHFYLLLSKLEPQIREHVASCRERWRPNTRNNTENFLRDGLKDRPITRDLSWGVPIPVDGFEDKRIYVWFEAVCGYLSASMLHSKNIGSPDLWESFWKDGGCRHYYFLAKDNIPFHTIIWPAILIGHGGLVLPYDVPSNEYLQWDGAQFSKSRGHGVTVNGFLKDYPADPLRFYLSVNMPERGDANFDLNEFVQKNNTELLGALGNYLHRVVTFVHNNFGETTPRGELMEADRNILASAEDAYRRTLDCMEKVRLKEGISIMMSLVNEANRYFNSMAPWKLVKEDRARCMTVLNVSLQIGKVIAYGMYPYIPQSMRKWCSIVGFKDPEASSWEEALGPVGAGQRIVAPPPLFQKLEVKEEEGMTPDDKGPVQTKEQIAIEQFGALDIRVGKVLEALDHPKADKLYVLKVDVGEQEPRQIITGLKGHYERDDLVGRTIIVLCNLKPANMRGLSSNGMLLASEADGEVVLLTTEGDSRPGATVH